MKIERDESLPIPIEEFAELHNLTMQVTKEYPVVRMRVLARFDGVFLEEGYHRVTAGLFQPDLRGCGTTEFEAIADYIGMISGELLILDHGLPSCRIIRAPRIIPWNVPSRKSSFETNSSSESIGEREAS